MTTLRAVILVCIVCSAVVIGVGPTLVGTGRAYLTPSSALADGFRDAIFRQDLDQARTLRRKEYLNVNERVAGVGLPLGLAADRGDTVVAELLFARGADANLTGWDGRPPIFAASERDHPDTLRCLLRHGARVRVVDFYGRTPLIAAAPCGSTSAVSVLLQFGSPVDARDHEGKTALMWASEYGHADTVRTLLAAGASPGLKDRSGHTAKQLAAAAIREVDASRGNALPPDEYRVGLKQVLAEL